MNNYDGYYIILVFSGILIGENTVGMWISAYNIYTNGADETGILICKL